MNRMNYMFEAGFLGTRSPFFMDFVTVIVALLPFLVAGAIYLATMKKYKLHAIAQVVVFSTSVVVLIYFETGVRIIGGFKSFMDGSSVDYNYVFFVLIFHIIIATITLLLWFITVIRVNRFLPSGGHKLLGKITFVGITLTSLTGIWVYLLLFVY